MTQWTKTPPAEPGWYWVIITDQDSPFYGTLIVEKEECYYWVCGNITPVSEPSVAYWLGPLEAPEPPEDL